VTLSNSTRRLGAIVAGGRASRFGGDKGAALLGGTALIDHAARVLMPWVDEIIVCGREWPGYRSIVDCPAPDLGPLGGIAAALFAGEGYGAVLTIGCDMPEVPEELIEALLAGGSRYCSDAPILGCWSPALAKELEAHLLTGGDRSIRRWAASVGAIGIPAPSPLANINTAADLAAL
jgi:molybdopterin-guanine dinucleotide biosynthesis protein A